MQSLTIRRGKLHSIVQENGDTKKVYLPDEKDENFIASIITIEKKTGNKIINKW